MVDENLDNLINKNAEILGIDAICETMYSVLKRKTTIKAGKLLESGFDINSIEFMKKMNQCFVDCLDDLKQIFLYIDIEKTLNEIKDK